VEPRLPLRGRSGGPLGTAGAIRLRRSNVRCLRGGGAHPLSHLEGEITPNMVIGLALRIDSGRSLSGKQEARVQRNWGISEKNRV